MKALAALRRAAHRSTPDSIPIRCPATVPAFHAIYRCRPATPRYPRAARSVPGNPATAFSDRYRAWLLPCGPGSQHRLGPKTVRPAKLDFADEAERGLERLGARSPLRRAYFARMRGDILRGPDLAQQFLGVAADAVVMYFHDL